MTTVSGGVSFPPTESRDESPIVYAVGCLQVEGISTATMHQADGYWRPCDIVSDYLLRVRSYILRKETLQGLNLSASNCYSARNSCAKFACFANSWKVLLHSYT